MIARAKEAVTAHINREVGPNIAIAITVVLENTRARVTRWTSIRNWQEREGCYDKRTAKLVGEEALLVAEEAQGASEETGGYARRVLNRGWRATTMG